MADGTNLLLPYGSGICDGHLSEDTVHFGDYDIKKCKFGEITIEPGAVWVQASFFFVNVLRVCPRMQHGFTTLVFLNYEFVAKSEFHVNSAAVSL